MKVSILKSVCLILLMGTMNVFAQKSEKQEQVITIKSFIACQSCVNRIENDLPYLTKGIKEVKADAAKNEITVTYQTNKTTPEDIRKGIAAIGYDADDIKADEKAFTKLPKHCRESILNEKAGTSTQGSCH